MGQLDDFVVATETVEYNGRTFTVNGLGLQQITYVIRHHGETLTSMYAQAVAGTLPQSIEGVAFAMADEFAPIAGRVIACGLGEPQNAEIAAGLPLGLQRELLEKIISLTLVETGGLGKLMESVTMVLRALVSIQPQKR